MAVAEMQKLTLVGFNGERDRLMRTLHRLGCAEISRTKDLENTSYLDTENEKDGFSIRLARLQFCFDFIDSQKKYLKPLIKNGDVEIELPKKTLEERLSGRPSVTFEQFLNAEERAENAFAAVAELEKLNADLQELKTEIVKADNVVLQLQPYAGFKIGFDRLKDTKNAAVLYGTVPAVKIGALKTALDAFPEVCFEFFEGRSQCAAIFVCLKEFKEALSEKLSACDFAAASFSYGGLPSEIIEAQKKSGAAAERQRVEIAERAIAFENRFDDFKLLYDYYTIELSKQEAASAMKGTSSSYIMEAWLPSSCSSKLEKTLTESRLSLYFTLTPPAPDETPPTLAINNGVVDSYESITEMYSSPAYGELDPNPFVAFFYFFFFGIMLSDAMYGVILSIATGAMLLIKKTKKGEDKLLKVLFMGGLSTIIWGVLFGSYAGEESFAPVLFSPLGDPLAMMIMSVVFGAVQMLFGICLKAYSLFKQKKPVEAIAASVPWILFFAGIAVIALGMMLHVKAMTTAAFVLLGLALAGLLLAGAVGKKGFKRVTGGLGRVYDIVGLVSDLFSYTRLFGLGIASGVIAMVLNQIALIFVELIPFYLGYLVAVPFLLVGHMLNLGIEALGAYVHDARLQFVEFFGKFYTGGGELFRPLGANLKYYKIQK